MSKPPDYLSAPLSFPRNVPGAPDVAELQAAFDTLFELIEEFFERARIPDQYGLALQYFVELVRTFTGILRGAEPAYEIKKQLNDTEKEVDEILKFVVELHEYAKAIHNSLHARALRLLFSSLTVVNERARGDMLVKEIGRWRTTIEKLSKIARDISENIDNLKHQIKTNLPTMELELEAMIAGGQSFAYPVRHHLRNFEAINLEFEKIQSSIKNSRELLSEASDSIRQWFK